MFVNVNPIRQLQRRIPAAVMWCLETLSRLETVSRQTFRCLGLGLGLEGHCLGLGLGLATCVLVLNSQDIKTQDITVGQANVVVVVVFAI
jgi:hypothetical protein